VRRFDSFAGSAKEKTARNLGVVGINVRAVWPGEVK
jgi:hypothetical protein